MVLARNGILQHSTSDAQAFYSAVQQKSKLMPKIINVAENYKKQKAFFEEKFGFILKEPPEVTEAYKQYLAGFIEGEGSLNVSIKKQQSSRMGCYVDPEFSVSQHNRAPENLFGLVKVFQTGVVTPGKEKQGPGSKADFSIGDRRAIREKVIPFYKQYVFPYCSAYLKERVLKFEMLLAYYEQGFHLKMETLLEKLAPLSFELRSSKASGNIAFKNLAEFEDYCLAHCQTKLSEAGVAFENKSKQQIFALFDLTFPTQGPRN